MKRKRISSKNTTEIYEKIELPLIRILRKTKMIPPGYLKGIEPEDMIIEIITINEKREKVFVSIKKTFRQSRVNIGKFLEKIWTIIRTALEIVYFWKKFK